MTTASGMKQFNLFKPLVAPTLLLLGACTTLGPDYERPPTEWLPEWEPGFSNQLHKTGLREDELEFWWKLFQDPVLDRLIEILRQDNLSLRIAGLRVMESRAQLGIAGSLQYPQAQSVDATGAYTEQDPSQTGSGKKDTLTTW